MINYLLTRPHQECAIFYENRAYTVGEIVKFANEIKQQLLSAFSDCKYARILIPTSNPAYFLSAVMGCWMSQCVAIPLRQNQDESDKVNYDYVSPDAELSFSNQRTCSISLITKVRQFINEYVGDVILTTSGSTGAPKGVCLTLSQLVINSQLTGNSIGLGNLNGWAIETDLALTSGFCHLLMSWAMRVPLTYLRNTSINNKRAFFTKRNVGYGGSPIQALRLADEIAVEHAPEAIMVSGDFFTAAMIAKIRKKFPAVSIHKCYGLSELAGRFCIMPSSLIDEHPDAVGYPLPGYDVQILDEDGQICEQGTIGTIHVKSPLIMHGYLKDNKFCAQPKTDWFSTNDLAKLGDNSLIYLYGRANDSFKVGGEKVDRFTIEQTLSGLLPGIEFCVLPTPHAYLGFVPTLYISKNSTVSLPRWKDILSYLSERLPRRFLPVEAKLIDSLPRTGSGKLDRKKITLLDAVELAW